MVHLLPHWNWPDEFKGKEIPVWAYTNAESVELFLNDKSLGTRDWTGVKETHLAVAGAVRSRARCARSARKGGKVVAEDVVETTRRRRGSSCRWIARRSAPTARTWRSSPSGSSTRAAASAAPTAIISCSFALTGAGSIAGVDNGDPTNHEPFKGPTPRHARSTRRSTASRIVVLRAPRNAATMRLTAKATGVTAATVRVTAAR